MGTGVEVRRGERMRIELVFPGGIGRSRLGDGAGVDLGERAQRMRSR